MTITLYKNKSDKNVLNKDIQPVGTYPIRLKSETSVLDPVILLQLDNFPDANYARIEEFGRYYFFTESPSFKNNMWNVSLHSDPLMSNREQIRNCSGILDGVESGKFNKYLPGDQWVVTTKTKTDIINFPNGLEEDGHFILITAGG